MTRGGARPWSSVAAWGWVFLGGLGLACLIAPAAYALLVAALPRLDWPFARVFNRVAMAVAVLVLLAMRLSVGWKELHGSLSQGSRGERARELGVGFVAALAGVAVGLAAAFLIGELGWATHEYRFLAVRTATALAG